MKALIHLAGLTTLLTLAQGTEFDRTAAPTIQRVVTGNRGEKEARHQLLSTNLGLYSLARPGNIAGYVPKNTLAFQEYALDTLLGWAQFFNRAWNLGVPEPVGEESVTLFSAFAKSNGLSGGIRIEGRYSFAIAGGRVENFRDLQYWLNAYENRPEKFREVMLEGTNLLTTSSAEQLARDALKKLGLTDEQLNLREPPRVEQWNYQPGGRGTVYKLPHYEVEWKFNVPAGTDPRRAATAIRMEISGITSNVASFFNNSSQVLQVRMPANYWQMLGVEPSSDAGSIAPGASGASP